MCCYCSYFHIWILKRVALIWLLLFTSLKLFLDDIITTMHLHAVTTTGYSGSTRSQQTCQSFLVHRLPRRPRSLLSSTTAVLDIELRASVLVSASEVLFHRRKLVLL